MFITFRIFQAPKNLSPYIVQAVSLFSEMPDAPVDKLARWQDRWDTGKTGWHKDTVNQNLSKHFEKLTKGQKDLKFLFPLCGKTLDMIWVYKQGHQVIGVEGILAPVEQFFSENDIKVNKEWDGSVGGWIFTSEDNRIKIVVCDLFKITPEVIGGVVDCVFDRGSYVAIEKEDRKKYIELMYSLYSPEARHLAVTHEYDWTKHDGPPRHVDRDELGKFYKEIGDKAGKSATVEYLDHEVETENVARFNLEEMTIVNMLITNTSSK